MPDTMRGLWLAKGQLTFHNDLPIPSPAKDEALIRTRLAGICGTDIQLSKGYYEFEGIPGHEFVGEIVAAPNQTNLIGQRVVGEINIGCGVCELCRQGNQKHCLNRKVLGIKNHHGAMAEYFTLPLKNIHIVDDSISDENAVFTEPLAAALHIAQQIDIKKQDRVLLIGAGKLGILIALALSRYTEQLHVLTRYQRQIDILHEHNIKTVSETALCGTSWPYIIEASGASSGFATAMEHISPMGSIVVKSTYNAKLDIPLSKIVVDEITILGSRCGDFDIAIEILRTGKIPADKLIAKTFEIDDAITAFETAKMPGVGKVLISFTA